VHFEERTAGILGRLFHWLGEMLLGAGALTGNPGKADV